MWKKSIIQLLLCAAFVILLPIVSSQTATGKGESDDNPFQFIPVFGGGPPKITPGVPAFQAQSWLRLGGPPGGLGYDIRYNFKDPKIWYVTDANSGFHISRDRGLTWTRSNRGIGTLAGSIAYPVFSATVDTPDDPRGKRH